MKASFPSVRVGGHANPFLLPEVAEGQAGVLKLIQDLTERPWHIRTDATRDERPPG